jgi:hypothetical protein
MKALAFALPFMWALALSPRGALALDGNELLQRCASIPDGKLFCTGFVDGIHRLLRGSQFHLVCSPDDVTTGQVRDIAVRYLLDHPADRHHNAEEVVTFAMIEAFPCAPPKQ